MGDMLTWYLGIDWDNNGSYTDEAGLLTALNTNRERRYLVNADGKGFETVRPGQMNVALKNEDGRFDAYNTLSPLYPYVSPGPKFILRVTDEATSTLYDVMTGNISDVRPVGGGRELNQVRVSGVDGLDFLSYVDCTTALQTSINLEDAIAAVLTAVSWPDGSSLDATSDVLSYWWASGRKANTEIQDLVDANAGVFFCANDGTAKFYKRIRAAAALFTLDGNDIRAGSLEMPQPWEVVRNAIRLYCRPRTAQTSGDLWQLNDTPLVPAGESLEVWANFAYNNERGPATNVVNPIATTDYLMNSLPNGSGTNLTANFTVTPTIFADTAKLVVANTGATDGYITLLKIRGQAITTTETLITKEDAASITRYRRREFTLDGDWLQDINNADDLSSLLVQFLSTPKPFPCATVRGIPSVQFAPDLFDTVTLDFPDKGIAGDHRVEQISHHWLDCIGQVVDTRFRFGKHYGSGDYYWIFPATVGVSTRFTG